jgi:hypothetical protein
MVLSRNSRAFAELYRTGRYVGSSVAEAARCTAGFFRADRTRACATPAHPSMRGVICASRLSGASQWVG